MAAILPVYEEYLMEDVMPGYWIVSGFDQLL
jgi:hypothetical protein